MNRADNLKPLGNGERTPEQELAIRRKGAEAANEVRRKRKTMREALDYLLTRKYTNDKGENASGVEIVAIGLFNKARSGDTAAVRLLAEIVGEAQAQGVTSRPQIVGPEAATAQDVADIIAEE